MRGICRLLSDSIRSLDPLTALTHHHTIHHHQIIIIFYNTYTISTPIAPNHPSGSTRHIWTPARRQPAAPLHLQYRPSHQPTAADFRSPLLIAHHPDTPGRYIHLQNHQFPYRTPAKKVSFYIYTGNIAALLSISYISTIQKTPYFIKMHIILYI